MNTNEKSKHIKKHKLFLEKHKSKGIHLSSYNLNVHESLIEFLKSDRENTILISGNTGIGKTHLIHFLLTSRSKEDSIYIDTSDFIETIYEEAKLNKPIQETVNWLHSYSIIVFDNFHLSKNKQKIISFFHFLISKTINPNKKIIFIWTKNSLIEKIPNLGREINFPDPNKESMKGIATNFLEFNYKNLKLTNKALDSLVETIPPNIKILISKLLEFTLSIESNLPPHLIKEDEVKKILNNKTKYKYGSVEQTTQHLIQKICRKLKFDQEEILSNSRRKDVVYKRNIVIYLVKKLSKLSHQEIGEIFNRNHSTITHSIKQIEARMNDKYFKEYLKVFL